MASRPLGVISARWTTTFRPSLRNRTDPSPNSTYAPPGWKGDRLSDNDNVLTKRGS